MRYRLLGRSGLRVSEFALGTMTFGEDWGWGASRDESQRIFTAFAEANGNFIDTANNYTDGTSERYVGEFIAADREHFVVATKYTLATRPNDPNAGGNHRKNMVQSVEASLRRLNTEYLDLLWVHAWDFLTPVEEVMRALDDLTRAGKVLYVGISDTPAWVVAQANTLADCRGWSRFVALQAPYSLAKRDVERELLPMARSFEMAFTPWGTIGGGVLTGKYDRDDAESTRYDRNKVNEKTLHLAKVVVEVAREVGRPPAQVAINWVRQQPGLIIPLIGARTAVQMRENLGSFEWTLSPQQVEILGAASQIDLGFPHNFLASGDVQRLIFGGTLPLIDNHRGP